MPEKKQVKNYLKSVFQKITQSFGASKKSLDAPLKKTVKVKLIQDIIPIKTKKIFVTKKLSINKKPAVGKKKLLNPKSKKKIVKKEKKEDKTTEKKELVKFKKEENNPIISPRLYSWESKATFNPAAFVFNDKVHIIYRAMGDDDSSCFGYAVSADGLKIDERPTYCIYKRLNNFIKTGLPINYSSGGGENGGCEDPRIALIDGTLYIIYTAFDGWGSLRMALSSISAKDFENRKWNWKKEVLISRPEEMNKNWVLFPEKINGKFAIMHSFYPKILVDYFDSLDELNGKKFIKSNNTRPVDKDRTWDSWFRGIGPTPIRTDEGWLLLYHAMDYRNPDRYRMGALLLDLNDPTKILYRSKNPILEPEEEYENDGHKWGVVYSCGAIIKDETLLVYYGGSDKFVCVASINLRELINDLKKDKIIKLKIIKKKKKI